MSWRLPPPIWIAPRRQTLLAALLQLGAMAWRLVKWCLAAGFAMALLKQLTAATDSLWSAAGWLVAGALLVFLWERYGIADVACGAGRRQRLLAVATLLALALAGTWVVAHFAGALAVLAAPA